ncbi:MAG: DegV family protein [Clostridia bacterium]|nr:DegV family protein [Clostridia bacterium]
MKDYIIMTDSSCDLPARLADEMALTVLPLSVYIEDTKYVNYLDEREIAFSELYAKLRTKCPAKTSAINMNDFLTPMDEILRSGRDILYIGFSSGLSGTYNAGAAAAQEMAEKYPERKVYAVDSLCASMGQGLLVYHAWKHKQAGESIEQVRDWVLDNRLHLCHYFTIDDLMFLKRGGRVSGATAVVGSMLSIKPIMHVDNEGHLIKIGTARGRKASIRALADGAGKLGIDLENQVIFISHGDCLEEAEYLAGIMRERFHVKDVVISYVGPVIGAHSGPGTIALFFLGTER